MEHQHWRLKRTVGSRAALLIRATSPLISEPHAIARINHELSLALLYQACTSSTRDVAGSIVLRGSSTMWPGEILQAI